MSENRPPSKKPEQLLSTLLAHLFLKPNLWQKICLKVKNLNVYILNKNDYIIQSNR